MHAREDVVAVVRVPVMPTMLQVIVYLLSFNSVCTLDEFTRAVERLIFLIVLIARLIILIAR